MEKTYDIKNLPFWARIPFLWRYSKVLCFIGLHVPVRLEYENKVEVICQECTKAMALDDWKRFFKKV